jgi:Rrf2 family protein
VPLFNAKLDYALRAVVDLAMQPPNEACQSREIASRQAIRGPYLDQILAVLKREGIVRSIRGAGGGYTLARGPHRITVGEIVRAVIGDQFLVSGSGPGLDATRGGAAYIVRQFEEKAEKRITELLDQTTVADLVADKQRLDESLSYMPGI